MFQFILKAIFQQSKMHESTLDLFCNHDDEVYADEYAKEIELKAAALQVTVDYYIAEFL